MISKRVREMIEDGASYPLASSSDEEEIEFTKLCSNENPYGPSPKAIETIKSESENVGEYPESSSRELKEAISDYIGTSPVQICVGNGSDEIMDLACKSTMDPGDSALIPIPTFSQYALCCRANAMSVNYVELEDYRWNTQDLIEGMKNSKVVFIGRPNNPTGNSIDEEGLKELLDVGKMVIVDEAYVEFADYTVVDWVQDYDNLLVLRTFSKMFGLAGLRVGYGVCNSELATALERVRPPFSVNRLAQNAAVAALEDEEFLKKTRKAILDGREYLSDELEKLGFEVLSSDANFLMASPSPLGMDASDVCNYLSRKGILIRNLSGFKGVGSEWVRITVGKPDQNESLINALKSVVEDEK